MTRDNPNCDGNGPHGVTAEVRVLSLAGSNLHVCLACYHAEIAFRRDRNKKLTPDARFDLPRWEGLKVAYAETD